MTESSNLDGWSLKTEFGSNEGAGSVGLDVGELPSPGVAVVDVFRSSDGVAIGSAECWRLSYER